MRNLRSVIILVILGIASSVICQNNYSAHVDQPDPLTTPSICVVTTIDTNNVVVWEKNSSFFTDYFGVYRESTNQTDQWDLLGVVNYGETSTFIDSTSNPANQSYNYKISAIDLCGNETELSESHKTMNLSIALGINNSFSLIWSEYEGFVVNSYDIYRGTSETELQKIASTAAGNFNYNDYNPPLGDVYYQIEVTSPNVCDPTQLKSIATYSSSRSNIVTSKTTTSVKDHTGSSGITIYPNPFKERLFVKVPWTGSGKYNFAVYDLAGKMIYEQRLTAHDFEFRRGDLKAGIYIVEIIGEKIYRDKIIISD